MFLMCYSLTLLLTLFSVGFIGYPNVGKSSVINTLKKERVCPAAPIPGHTKVWQYITLFRRIFLIDCPGVVYPSDDSEADIVLKGVVRIESLDDATEYIKEVLARAKKHHIINTYSILEWTDYIDFLTQLSKKTGKLLKGGEPDLNAAAKSVLHDWLKGRLPYFVPPGDEEDGEEEEDDEELEEADEVDAELKADFDREGDDDDDDEEGEEDNEDDE